MLFVRSRWQLKMASFTEVASLITLSKHARSNPLRQKCEVCTQLSSRCQKIIKEIIPLQLPKGQDDVCKLLVYSNRHFKIQKCGVNYRLWQKKSSKSSQLRSSYWGIFGISTSRLIIWVYRIEKKRQVIWLTLNNPLII